MSIKRISAMMFIALSFVGVVYADTSISCDDYFSQYDCVFHMTEAHMTDPVGICSICSGYDYPAEFSVDTGVCTYIEFNQTADAFSILYANQSDQTQHLKTMQQCKALASADNVGECFEACSSVVTGSALSACMNVCTYDDGFGGVLEYMLGSNVCSVDDRICKDDCEELSFLSDHCEIMCNDRCDYNKYKRGGSLHDLKGYCGDGIVANGEDCDDGFNYNGDGCDYNCHREDGYPRDASGNGSGSDESWLDELLDTGPRAGHDSVVEQLIDRENDEDTLFPNENEDPEELPKSGAYILDTVTSKVLFVIALLAMTSLMITANRSRQ